MNRKYFLGILCLSVLIASGCADRSLVQRVDLLQLVPRVCKEKFQAIVKCRAVGDTLWVYLPYAQSRSGLAKTLPKDNDLLLEYQIASLNPYRILEPPELKFVVQKILREIRELQLRCDAPYKFFVLVATNIADPMNQSDQWHIGYFEDLKPYAVCLDFSKEGYSRLVWSNEKIKVPEGWEGSKGSVSYQDVEGNHVDYHDITLKEFVTKQIEWRVYKRFTIEYNTVPFDLMPEEKRQAVLDIVKTVFLAYNFNEWENIYLRDSSFLSKEEKYTGEVWQDLQKQEIQGVNRRPAF